MLNFTTTTARLLAFPLIAAAALLIGCSSQIQQLQIQPSATSLKNWTLQLDVIGVTPSDKARYENIDINQYFTPGSAASDLRRDGIAAKRIRTYTWSARQGPNVITLDSSDPVWQNWQNRGVTELVVIANLPAGAQAASGNLDARQLIIPMSAKRWASKTVQIAVSRTGLTALTPETPG